MDTVSDFAYKCVLNYSTYNPSIKQHDLSISDLPDTVLEEFAYLCTGDDLWASESTGLDNTSYSSKMLPALRMLLRDSASIDNKLHFADVWKEKTSEYFKDVLSDLIKKELENYNYRLGLSYTDDMYARECGSRLTFQGGA